MSRHYLIVAFGFGMGDLGDIERQIGLTVAQ